METTEPKAGTEGNRPAEGDGEDEVEDPKRTRLDELADEAAEESFPASDPPAVHIEEPEP